MFALSLVTMLWYVGADIYADVKLEDLGESYDAATHDFSQYINNTILQIEHLTDDNYLEFEANVEVEIQQGVDAFDTFIQNHIVGGEDVNVQELYDIVSATNDVIEMYGGDEQVVGSRNNVIATTDAYAVSAGDLKVPVDALRDSQQLEDLIGEAVSQGFEPAELQGYIDGLTVQSDLALAVATLAATLPAIQISDPETLQDLETEIESALEVSVFLYRTSSTTACY